MVVMMMEPFLTLPNLVVELLIDDNIKGNRLTVIDRNENETADSLDTARGVGMCSPARAVSVTRRRASESKEDEGTSVGNFCLCL